MSQRVLISAGEASGDLYAAHLVSALRARNPESVFFGCTGPRMRAQGVETIVDAHQLAVVGLVEVVRHIPSIYRQYRRLLRAATERRPALAILVDSPDFHLRLARRLRRLNIPVLYFVAPQVWAWRRGRIHSLRRDIDRLLCIFPFEEEFFRQQGIAAEYIGHPLTTMVRPLASRRDFRRQLGIGLDQPTVALMPGSRLGEAVRHLPILLDCVMLLRRQLSAAAVIGLPAGLLERLPANFRERITALSIQVVEGRSWDVLAHSDVALAASGTVTVEAALLGTPMVTFYRVSRLSWLLGRRFVKVPYLTMVNLLANRKIVAELMQEEMTPERLASEASRLLLDSEARERMGHDLAEVRRLLETEKEPLDRAAEIAQQMLGAPACLAA